MINVSGLKVYSEEVDEILQSHPAVTRAATIGVPDPERPGSERVKIYVELEEEYEEEVEKTDLIEYLKDKVAKYAVPQEVEFIDEMPPTPIGKIDKRVLRSREEGEN